MATPRSADPACRTRFWSHGGPLALALCCATLLAAVPRARAQSVESTIDRAVAAWSRVRSIQGTFEQTVVNPLVGSSVTAHGQYAQQRPDRLAIRFSKPLSDAIVADGRWLWIYLPNSAPGQVIKRSATNRGAVPIDLTGQFLDSPRTKYDMSAAGTATVDGHGTHAMTLVPKPGVASPFTTATVWIDDDDSLIRRFEETEQLGVVRRVHLTSLELNGRIAPATFTFTVPAGVRIVDQTKD